MTPGQLVRVVANVLGIPEATMVVYDRRLIAEGLRSKAGHGRGSAQVTARDAAHLLTAALGSAQVKDAVPAVRRYTETRPEAGASTKKIYAQLGISELTALPATHSFIDALDALIASASTGSLGDWLEKQARAVGGSKLAVAPQIEIWALAPGTVAEIRISGLKENLIVTVRYAPPTPWDSRRKPPKAEIDAWEEKIRQARSPGDLETQRRITTATILRIAEALASGKEN